MSDHVGLKGAAARVPYTMAPNAMLRDRSLSAEARLFLAYVESFDPGWVFFVSRVALDLGWGRDKLRGVVRECERAGALIVRRKRGEAGRISGFFWSVSWRRWAEAIGRDLLIEPVTCFQPVAEKPAPDIQSRKEEQTQEGPPPGRCPQKRP